MIKKALGRLVKRLVIRSAVGPVRRLFINYYWVVARCAAWALARDGRVGAVYLKRSAAKNEISPGISDIDLAVIVRGGQAERAAVVRKYQTLARFLPYLDRSFQCNSVEELKRNYPNLCWAYRYHEGISTWQLLHGADFVRELRPLQGEHLEAACAYEVKTWWTHAVPFVTGAKAKRPFLLDRSIFLFRLFAEVAKQLHAQATGELVFARSAALARAKTTMSPPEVALATSLEELAGRQYRGIDETHLDEASDVVVGLLRRFFAVQDARLQAGRYATCRVEVDYLASEAELSGLESTDASWIRDELLAGYGQTLEASLLPVPVEFRNLDDRLVLLRWHDTERALLQECRTICRRLADAQPSSPSKVHVFVQVGPVALRLSPGYDGEFDKSMLTSAWHPELYGNALAWREFIKWSLENAKERAFGVGRYGPLLASDTLAPLEFLRRFWKALQIGLIQRSSAGDEFHYPMTVPAIMRAMTSQGVSAGLDLNHLWDAYKGALRGVDVVLTASERMRANHLAQHVAGAGWTYDQLFVSPKKSGAAAASTHRQRSPEQPLPASDPGFRVSPLHSQKFP